jgi:O-methyltransferase domain/Dimerisation domain
LAPPDLWELVNNFRLSQALSVAARLGIADELKDGGRTSDELATAVGAHPDALYRLLRALASVGVLHEDDGRTFSLTESGYDLRSDSPTTVAGWASFIGSREHWQTWGDLMHSIRTGENAFRHLHGTDVWTYRTQHPEAGPPFDRAMGELTRRVDESLVGAYDFGRFETLVDVGGGRGALLRAILAANPRLTGILFDQPHVVEGIAPIERATVVGGSFFDAVPEGADAYVLKWIIHDWEDPEARAILQTCRRAMRRGGTVLVIDRVVGPPNEDPLAKFSDLNMLVMPGGRERTREEFAALFDSAGLRLADVYPAGPMAVIEAVAQE